MSPLKKQVREGLNQKADHSAINLGAGPGDNAGTDYKLHLMEMAEGDSQIIMADDTTTLKINSNQRNSLTLAVPIGTTDDFEKGDTSNLRSNVVSTTAHSVSALNSNEKQKQGDHQ